MAKISTNNDKTISILELSKKFKETTNDPNKLVLRHAKFRNDIRPESREWQAYLYSKYTHKKSFLK